MLSALNSKSLSAAGTAKAISNTQKKSSSENSASKQSQNSDAKENTTSSAVKDKVALNKVTKFKDGMVSERVKDIGNMALKDQVEASFPVPDTSKSSSNSQGTVSPPTQSTSAPQTSPPNFGQGSGAGNGGGFGSSGGFSGGSSQNNPWLGQPNVHNPPTHNPGNNETQSLSSFANNLLKDNQIASYKLNNHNGHMDLELSGVKHGAMDSIQQYAKQHGEQLTAKCDANGCSVDINSKNHQEQAQEVERQQQEQSQQNALQDRDNQEQMS